jgi:hypothetical protein
MAVIRKVAITGRRRISKVCAEDASGKSLKFQAAGRVLMRASAASPSRWAYSHAIARIQGTLIKIVTPLLHHEKNQFILSSRFGVALSRSTYFVRTSLENAVWNLA